MYTKDTRKISVIEEVLKIDNEETLDAVEAVLKKVRKKKSAVKSKSDIFEFVGILTSKEAELVRTTIAQTNETIHPDDWK